MTDKELMQMALDALESSRVFVTTREKIKHPEGTEWYDERIEALRAALTQGEQEPVACIVKGCRNHKHEGHFVGDLCGPCHTFITAGEGKYSQAYRNAKREWQGLTDEEVGMLAVFDGLHHVEVPLLANFIRAIETKLKEKNT